MSATTATGFASSGMSASPWRLAMALLAAWVAISAATAGVPATFVGWPDGAAPSGTPAAPAADPGAATGALAGMPVSFVENRGQLDPRVVLHAHGGQHGVYFLPGAVRLSLPGDGGDRAVVDLRFVGGDATVVPQGVDATGGVVSYVRGSDSTAWQSQLPAFGAVAYRELWPGIDMVLRDDGGQLKYEFHVRPGARPSDIRLAYAGAGGVALGADGGLRIDTAAGVLHDSAPVSWQEVGGERAPVASRFDLAADGSYGFALGAFDARAPLVIDPGLDYSTFVGGSSHEQAHGVAVAGDGTAVVVGMTQSEDFPVTTGAVDGSFNGGVMDVFVAKVSADGSRLEYATYLGGTPAPLRRGTESPTDVARSVAIDADGNAYVTGQTTSPEFPTTSGVLQPSLRGVSTDVAVDAFVVKLSGSGSLVYSTFLGGAFWEDGRDIAVDGGGRAIVVGETSSDDFPTTAGAVQPARAGNRDAFVAVLDATASSVVYGTYLGGASELDRADAVALDGSGALVLSGSTRSVDFPTTEGSFQPTHSGGEVADLFEVFVAKIDPASAGAAGLRYATFLGTPRMDLASDLAVDGAGAAYVTGSAGLSAEFPVTPGAYDTTGTTSSRGFVAKLDVTGSALTWATFFPVTRIALAGDGSSWLAGGTGAGAEVTADGTPHTGATDAYLAHLDPTGSSISFGSYLGGSRGEGATSVALAPAGAVVIAGNTMSSDFPTTVGAFDRTWAGDPALFWGDAFVARYTPEGGGDTTPPPPVTRTTSDFSGRIDRDQTVTHTVAIDGTGPVDLALNWSDSRANLSIRVRDGSGATVFSDTSNARPKQGTFEVTAPGTHRFEITNTTRRSTGYTLSVVHPTGGTTQPPPSTAEVDLITLDPTSVTGGTSSTGMVALTAAAPAGGAEVALSSSNTSAATAPPSVTVAEGQTSATFTVSTSPVSANTAATITASYGGASVSASLAVNADAGPTMSTLTLQPNPVTGGSSSTGTATLTAPAPAGGAVVTLISSNTDVATVPATVTVAGGQTSATFTVSTSPQEFNQSSAISASHGGVMKTVILSVTAGTSPALSSLALNPTSVSGGQSSTGKVTLTAAAPLGGTAVALSSSDTAAATVPSSVTVPAGETGATFTVSTSTVSTSTSATITASHNGVARTADLAVTAATTATSLTAVALSPTSVSGGESSTGTVTLSAAAPVGGATVSLTSSAAAAAVPASVTVTAGATSATFAVSTASVSADTSVTISATYDVTRTATLTVTAQASTDTVAISRAEYDGDKRQLRVEASSSASGATLQVFVTATGELIGTMSGTRTEFSWPSNPSNITVRSSLGGSATRSVTAK